MLFDSPSSYTSFLETAALLFHDALKWIFKKDRIKLGVIIELYPAFPGFSIAPFRETLRCLNRRLPAAYREGAACFAVSTVGRSFCKNFRKKRKGACQSRLFDKKRIYFSGRCKNTLNSSNKDYLIFYNLFCCNDLATFAFN